MTGPLFERLRDLSEDMSLAVHEKHGEICDLSAVIERHVQKMEMALGRIAEQQPKTLDWLRANGIIFAGPLGNDPDNWEHVAFSIYSDLCEADSIARAALSALDGEEGEA